MRGRAPTLRGALAGALLASGCAAAAEPPSLLLVVADSLRADALQCGGGGASTPNLCGLAARGASFERAYSNAPWTLPAAVSIFTGSCASSYAGGGAGPLFYVGDGEALLAESLRARGYDAVPFLENGLVARVNALQGFEARSFDRLVAFPSVHRALRAELGIEIDDPRYHRSLGLLYYLTRIARHPFFAVHWILDPHAQYAPPPEFERAIAVDEARLARPRAFYASLGNRNAADGSQRDLAELGPGLSDYERWYLRQLYLKEVESVDQRIGYALSALARAGLAERTLVVFTSDHGEGFGEHGLFLHGNSLYEELIRVPLVAAGPGIPAGLRVAAPVSHLDLMPTLAELLRADGPAQAEGRSFAALLRGGRDPAGDRLVRAVGGTRGGDSGALVQGRHKLIRRSGGGVELYDLADDPGERRELSGERPEVARALEARLAELQRASAERSRRNLAPVPRERLLQAGRETEEELRALGYVE